MGASHGLAPTGDEYFCLYTLSPQALPLNIPSYRVQQGNGEGLGSRSPAGSRRTIPGSRDQQRAVLLGKQTLAVE